MTTKLVGVEPQFFTAQNLGCRCCGTVRLMPGFLGAFISLQEACGVKFTINSMCRCPAHNARVGGHPRSLHLTQNAGHGIDGTCAVDLALPEGHPHRQLVWDTAWSRGWSIGNNPRFLHLDRRTDYIKFPQAVFRY
jgi:hypothetical protein